MKMPKNFGGAGFGNALAQAQQAMAQAGNLENELANMRLEVDRGPVKGLFTGTGEMIGLKIDKSIVDPEDVEALEDLIVGVAREGFNRGVEIRNERVNQIMPKIPGLNA